MYWQDDKLYCVGRQHVRQLKAHVFKHAVQLASVQSYCAVSCVKRCKCTNGTETNCGSTVRVLTLLNTQPSQIIQPIGLKLQLDWDMRYIVNLTMKPVSFSEIFVLWCHLTLASEKILHYYNMDDTSWTRHVDWSRVIFRYFTCTKPHCDGC